MEGMLSSQGPARQQAAPSPEGDATEEAMAIVRKSLYGAEAARDVAKALRAAGDPAEGIAMTAYEMVAVADDATNGVIPDEELIPFATEVLGEVADIAQAAGIKVRGAVIAKAMQMMLVRFVTEQGMDATQLQQAMAQMDPEEVGARLDKGV